MIGMCCPTRPLQESRGPPFGARTPKESPIRSPRSDPRSKKCPKQQGKPGKEKFWKSRFFGSGGKFGKSRKFQEGLGKSDSLSATCQNCHHFLRLRRLFQDRFRHSLRRWGPEGLGTLSGTLRAGMNRDAFLVKAPKECSEK